MKSGDDPLVFEFYVYNFSRKSSVDNDFQHIIKPVTFAYKYKKAIWEKIWCEVQNELCNEFEVYFLSGKEKRKRDLVYVFNDKINGELI